VNLSPGQREIQVIGIKMAMGPANDCAVERADIDEACSFPIEIGEHFIDERLDQALKEDELEHWRVLSGQRLKRRLVEKQRAG